MSSLQVGRSAALAFTNVVGGVGQALSASGNSGLALNQAINVTQYERLGLFIAVVGAPTGTTPSLTVSLQGLDPEGNLYALASGAALTAAGTQVLSVGPGMGATPIFVPQLVAVSWVITGTTPNFPNVEFTLLGR